MSNARVKVGDVLIYTKTTERYRIIQIKNFECLLICMDISKLKISRHDLKDIIVALESELFMLQEDTNADLILDDNEDMVFNKRLTIINAIMNRINNDLLSLIDGRQGILIKEISSEYNVSVVFIYKYLRVFLQGGMNYQVLYNKYSNCGGKGKEKKYTTKKAGRISSNSLVPLDDEVLHNFEKMLKYYVKKKCKVAKKDLYEKMIMDFYTQEIQLFDEIEYILKPISQIPSKRQFYYWLNKKITIADRYKIEFGSSVAKNDIRPLTSDTLYRNYGAGYCFEMDEMETDFYLVSSFNRSYRIGRAILYVIIDTYSKEIVGISVGLNNNSWNGANLALLNMIEDKVEYCKKYGVTIQEDEWPVSKLIPQSIRVDNGSEYICNSFYQFIGEQGINIQHVTAGCGSLKPNVEQSFNQFNKLLNGKIEGQIYKEHNSRHIEKATLNIYEFTQIVIYFVLNYNSRYMKSYPRDKDLISNNIKSIPNEIWNYSIYKHGCIRSVYSVPNFKFSLLKEGKARITRNGIEFKRLIYLPDDTEWINKELVSVAMLGARKLSIRYDDRNTNNIYFNDGEKIVIATLNVNKSINKPYLDLNWVDFDIQKELEKTEIINADLNNTSNNIHAKRKINEIVNRAKDSSNNIPIEKKIYALIGLMKREN
ncbi:MAG TPA: hypothetical protein DHW61_02040 [Lachnoclostridium phytofermentans]|uniref:Integrase catalytic domain-containing protein n=1 Tax=Lachnoclostridium phytofermentans TaxID=66219 RepID=A0A3D2X4D9_9FIRM|nr:hypothetical protein [Lachnoclostridium phytofermentans]